jgi:glycosyltransferase involved in cell wall biosynthesis
MKVVVQAVSAKMGGASAYLEAVAAEFARHAPEDEFLYLVPPGVGALGQPGNAAVRTTNMGFASLPRRFWFDQRELPRLLREVGADVLFSTANVALRDSPCHQVLLVRNALYFSEWYENSILPAKGLRAKLEYGLRRQLVVRSAGWADTVVTPSNAMLAALRRYVDLPPVKAVVSHYGVDCASYAAAPALPGAGELRLLFTGLYAEHKNLGTLFQALSLLADDVPKWQLLTTADPAWEPEVQNSIRRRDAEMARELGIGSKIKFTGVLSRAELVSLYRQADIFVYPSAVESFGHPLLEAMASGLPVIAADTPVNRELCGEAAVYFATFDAAECASRIRELAQSPAARSDLSQRGRKRAAQFSWRQHVSDLLNAFCRVNTRAEATTA